MVEMSSSATLLFGHIVALLTASHTHEPLSLLSKLGLTESTSYGSRRLLAVVVSKLKRVDDRPESRLIIGATPKVKHKYVGPGDHLTCWPLEDNHVSFLRKNGFRCIGRTALFGYAPKPSHPSRMLAADADVDAEAGAQPAA
ncbi:hypothetical protein Hypma_002759 [Hypsizygus marmoreus]|uniref:Uncharacterized protein n=1 Tax=Hypsizygus marmoreus TaxID=39966 RepID=A0A369JC43_HYPMA|nr:hypothetical protein Hypma_002759 [Hypsizygus marmoreus]